MTIVGDTQKFILEDLILYFCGITIDLTWDFLQNLFHATGLNATAAPYSFGNYQALLLLFFAIQVARKLNQWRYYQ